MSLKTRILAPLTVGGGLLVLMVAVLTLCVLLGLPVISVAQGLTEAQYATLNNDILVVHEAEFHDAVAAADYATIAAAYNVLAPGPFWVWKTSLTPKEIYESTADGGAWSWATYKAQTQQERDSWRDMMAPNLLNPSLKQTRDGWLAIFGGQGASQVQVNYLLALSKRQARRGEALFAITTGGNGQQATPANATMEGMVTYTDVYFAVTGARS